MAVPNVYYCTDDTGFSAGTASQQANPGSGSGFPLTPEFTAPSAAAAVTVAHIFASVMQRPLRLVTKYNAPVGQPPWTLVFGATANVALTSVPSGVGF